MHVKNKHLGYLCDVCQYQTKEEGDLKKHNADFQDGITYQCLKCEFKGVSQLNLEAHVDNDPEKLELQPQTKSFKCKQCEFVTLTKQTLKDHYLVNHGGKRYKCDLCEYKARNKINVKSHKQVMHEGITFDCKKCEFKSLSYHRLRNHIQIIHEGIVQGSKATLVAHKKGKHGPLHKCDKCDFESGYISCLKDHMLTKHELNIWIASQGLKVLNQANQAETKIEKKKRKSGSYYSYSM